MTEFRLRGSYDNRNHYRYPNINPSPRFDEATMSDKSHGYIPATAKITRCDYHVDICKGELTQRMSNFGAIMTFCERAWREVVGRSPDTCLKWQVVLKKEKV